MTLPAACSSPGGQASAATESLESSDRRRCSFAHRVVWIDYGDRLVGVVSSFPFARISGEVSKSATTRDRADVVGSTSERFDHSTGRGPLAPLVVEGVVVEVDSKSHADRPKDRQALPELRHLRSQQQQEWRRTVAPQIAPHSCGEQTSAGEVPGCRWQASNRLRSDPGAGRSPTRSETRGDRSAARVGSRFSRQTTVAELTD
jgi:hypothetical protein